MPIKFIEEMKDKSRRKKEEQGREPKRKRHDRKKEKKKKLQGERNEKKSWHLFKKNKNEQKPHPNSSKEKVESIYLNKGEDVIFVEEDRPNCNEYGNPDPENLIVNIAPTEETSADLNREYACPEPEQSLPKSGVEIEEVEGGNESPALVEHEVDVKEGELTEIRNTSPAINTGLRKLPSVSPENRPEELAALLQNPPTSNPESRQTEPTPYIRRTPSSKVMENAAPSVNELPANGSLTSDETEAESSEMTFKTNKMPTGPGFSAAIPTSSFHLIGLKSSEHNEPVKASKPPTSMNTDSTSQNKLTPPIKTSDQNEKPKPKPVVGILKMNLSSSEQAPIRTSPSVQLMDSSSQNRKPSSAKKPGETSTGSSVSSTKPQSDNVDDKPIHYPDIKKQWEQRSSANPYVKGSETTPKFSISNAALTSSRSSKNEATKASQMTASGKKAQVASKPPVNEKSKGKFDSDSESTTSSSSDESDSSTFSSTSNSSSLDSSDSDSWSTSSSSDSNSDSSSGSSSTDSDSDSDSDVTRSSCSTSTLEELVQKNSLSKPRKTREERF